MADIDASGRGEVKPSVDSSVALVRPGPGELPFTTANPYGEFQHQLFDASYDHSPYSSFNNPGSSMPSGGSGALAFPSNMHPFKIVQGVNDQGLVVTRVFIGRLRYCINTFNTVLENDTNSVQSYHASEKTDGQSGRPNRTTGSEGGHTHTLSGTTGDVSSQYNVNPHTHSLNSYGTLSQEPDHAHTVPNLISTTSTVDRFVTIKDQIAATGIIKEVEPTGFFNVNNENDEFTGIKRKDLTPGQFGSVFLKWKVLLPTDQNLGLNFTINSADVEVVMQGDATQTAEALSAQDTFEALELHDGNTTPPDDGIDDAFDRRGNGGGETDAGKTAYFYVKLGVSHNPADGIRQPVDQFTYENIYWSPLILGRAYDES